jgi:hypothetical protein
VKPTLWTHSDVAASQMQRMSCDVFAATSIEAASTHRVIDVWVGPLLLVAPLIPEMGGP